MHDLDRTLHALESEDAFEAGELDPEIFGASGTSGWTGETSLSEEDELDLASELLTLSSEAELDQFLGKLLKKAGRGFKTVFKPLAKTLLPLAGKVAGSFFGGPVGGALGSKLGSLASNLFEVDLEGLSPEDQAVEVAKRFVRLAATAAQEAAAAPASADPVTAARAAVATAARTHAPGLLRPREGQGSTASAAPPCAYCRHRGGRRAGRWIRHGRTIILLGA